MRSPASAAASGSGSMSTARSARWRFSRRTSRRGSKASSAPIRWPSIFTSGARCLTTPGSFWCAMACCIARPSPFPLRTCERNARPGGGRPWPCDYGPDLSRGFRALKTWFTLKVYGAEALGSIISRTCELARYLERRIAETPELELLAPVELNVVCFRIAQTMRSASIRGSSSSCRSPGWWRHPPR